MSETVRVIEVDSQTGARVSVCLLNSKVIPCLKFEGFQTLDLSFVFICVCVISNCINHPVLSCVSGPMEFVYKWEQDTQPYMKNKNTRLSLK
jgi:hypothetical protein